jgi:phage-related protein
MPPSDKELAWLHGEIRTPPWSTQARLEAGFLLRRLQRGQRLPMPHSRPMPEIGRRCHELRVVDDDQVWRIIYRVDSDAIVLLDIFSKKTRQTPKYVIETCKRRLRDYDSIE